MSLSRFIADLESQFDQERRDLQRHDVHELVVEERSAISIAHRLIASQGCEIDMLLRGGTRLAGRVTDAALTWVLLEVGHERRREEVLVPLDAIVEAGPLGRAVPATVKASWKLSLAAILRRLVDQGVALIIDHDAGQARGMICGVYADHIDMRAELDRYGDVRDSGGDHTVTIVLARVRKISVLASQW